VTEEHDTADRAKDRAKAQEERHNLKREIVESFPKFLVNVLIVLGVVLVYVFLIPWFRVLDQFPLLDIVNFGTTVVITGYSLLQCGVLLVILLFGVEALKEFAAFANAATDFAISRLPGMRSADRGTVRRIPLDVIYLLFVVIVYTLIQPVFLPGVFPIPALADIFQKLAVALALFFLLVFVYDLAKSIQKSAKRGIDKFGKRVAGHVKDDEEVAAKGQRHR
jgi:hypothetical protein